MRCQAKTVCEGLSLPENWERVLAQDVKLITVNLGRALGAGWISARTAVFLDYTRDEERGVFIGDL
jgi:hypothetical protein